MRARTPSRVLAAARLRPSTQVIPTRFQSTPSTSASASSSSSSSGPTPWLPVVAPGSSPVYDAALDYIRSHQSSLLSRLEKLQAIPNPTSEQFRELENLETEAYVNDPEVRHIYRETKGVGYMSRPVIRHIAEREWKVRGGLDLIMGRVYQNKIVPDLIPDLGPTNPLHLAITDGLVEPGSVLDSTVLEQPPSLTYQPYQHPSIPTASTPAPEALYTLLMVDPDTPEPAEHGYSERLHFLKTNIPLSILSGQLSLNDAQGDVVVPYEPPAPPNGSNKHRYVFFLLRQHPSSQSSSDAISTPARERFSTRDWLAANSFSVASVVGINFVRSEWTKDPNRYINRIWQDYRGVENGAPVYKRGPKEDRYSKPLSSLQQRAAGLRQRAWERSLAEFAQVGLAEGISDQAPDLEYEAELEEEGERREFEDKEGQFNGDKEKVM